MSGLRLTIRTKAYNCSVHSFVRSVSAVLPACLRSSQNEGAAGSARGSVCAGASMLWLGLLNGAAAAAVHPPHTAYSPRPDGVAGRHGTAAPCASNNVTKARRCCCLCKLAPCPLPSPMPLAAPTCPAEQLAARLAYSLVCHVWCLSQQPGPRGDPQPRLCLALCFACACCQSPCARLAGWRTGRVPALVVVAACRQDPGSGSSARAWEGRRQELQGAE